MMCVRLIVLLGIALPGIAVAQGAPARGGRGGAVATGIQVDGWRGRTDRSDQRIADVHFRAEGNGYRLTSGPHAALWHPANRAAGDYTVSARLTKLRSSGSAQEESYGIFIAGHEMGTGNQNYLYCVVFGTGKVMVRHRHGGETATLLGKTANAAVSRMGPDGVTDEVAMWVRGGRVGCSVNGTEVFSAPGDAMIGPGKLVSTDGVYGIRASHNLDLMVAGLGVRG